MDCGGRLPHLLYKEAELEGQRDDDPQVLMVTKQSVFLSKTAVK